VNRLHPAHRVVLYAALSVLLASGLAWEAMSPGTAASLVMKIHGAAGMLTLVLLGTLFAQHVPAGWTSNKNRNSGALLVAALTWLALSGYLLYYAGSESLRWYAAQSHLWVGIAACTIVGLHIRRSALT
jgi:hypothetical protein